MSITDQAEIRPRLIYEERRWRERPTTLVHANGTPARISISRWASAKVESPIEVSSDAIDDAHIISFAMRRTIAELRVGKVTLKSGTVPARTLFASGPIDKKCHSVHRHAFAFLQIHFPQALIAECYEYVYGHLPSPDIVLFGPQYVEDAVIDHLVLSLVNLDDDADGLSLMCMDCIGFALGTRLVGFSRVARQVQAAKRKPGLAKWRLNRVTEYIDSYLTSNIRLIDLSEVAGLSRMHFAAQFRKSTGMSPHAYVLHSRIVLSQELLRDPSLSVSDVALSVGFNSQSHFSGVFKRIVGKTPPQWRHEILG